MLTARIVDLDDRTVLQELGPDRVRTDRRGEASVTYAVDGAGEDALLVVLLVDVNVTGNKRVTKVALSCGFS